MGSRLWIGVLGWLVAATPCAAAPFCSIVAPQGSPPLVRQAATELSGYLERLTGEPVPVAARRAAGAPAVVLQVTASEKALGDEGYRLEPRGGGKSATLTIRGRTPLAVLHGAYRLLREYGFGFYFDGDAVPAERPSRFLLPRLQAAPVFAIRGSLPWYNFLNSPTTWDDQDFRFFADQILRSGQNFIGFHTYDNEPFAAYWYEGKLIGGEPLQTTQYSIWGTHPMEVKDFGFGTAQFFPGRYWGSDAGRMPGSREQRIAAQKAQLARGLAYASARGIKTCLGFEVSGDPTDPEEQRRFRARLTQLLRDYPMLDYVWLWQPEARSLEGTEPPALRSQGGRIFREWRSAFAYLKSPAREWEGMRMAGYARLARRLMDAASPKVKLVLSGWGGDNHLHISDYYPAWDKVLDRRIIFAALDDIVVGPKVSRYYKLPATRERWAIPWYEYDGDQWFPQANAHVFDKTVRDARAKGCQGLLAIHWRTKEVGESQALVAQYAWRPNQTLQGFYQDYALRRVGRKAGPEFGRILQELDALGYRWLGGPGQVECGLFGWCYVSDASRIERLKSLRARLEAVRRSLRGARCPSGAAGRVEDVIATLDRGLLFNRLAGLMVEGGPVDRALAMDPSSPERRRECARLLAELVPEKGRGAASEMLYLWAQTITSRGELGVLATINTKAIADLRIRIARLREAAGLPADIEDLSAPDVPRRALISDYQQTAIPAGAPLAVRCVAIDGGKPAQRVTLEYRTESMTTWASRPMKRLERSVFETTVPTPRAGSGWVRYRIRALMAGKPVLWPQTRGEDWRQVHLLEPAVLVSRRNRVASDQALALGGALESGGAASAKAQPALEARATPRGTVRLVWRLPGGLHEVSVERRRAGASWEELGKTLDWVWEDSQAPHRARLEYRLRNSEGRVLALGALQSPPAPAPARPSELVAVPRGKAVRLRWAGAELSVRGYTVERAWERGGPFTPISPEAGIVPEHYAGSVFVDQPGRKGPVYYRVRAHGHEPGQSTLGQVVAAEASDQVAAPLLDLRFQRDRIPAGCSFSGPYSFQTAANRSFLSTEGGLALPRDVKTDVQGPFTVVIRFRMRERTPIPVLVCQGAWGGPGYFLQLLGNSLRFYVGGAGYLDRSANIQPGEWHTIVAVYDGVSLSSYLDGKLLGEKASSGPFRPGNYPFTVARYSQIGPEWTFKGDVEYVRLFPQALEPDMVTPGE